MADRIKHAMQNGLLFVEDVAKGEPPAVWEDGAKVLNTPSCIAVSCMHEIDGEAEIVLGRADEVAPDYALDFDGMLETPSGQMAVTTVDATVLLKTPVTGVITRVRIWRNHPEWPDEITVGWG